MSPMKKIILATMMILLTVGAQNAWASANDYKSSEQNADDSSSLQQKPQGEDILTVNNQNRSRVHIETSLGTILIQLYDDLAPKTVANFLKLTGEDYYNGIIFHRVIPGFMVQTGDPTGTGMGGPGYSFKDEFHPSLKHDKPGMLSMANSGPNTNGSQFFITVAETPWLNNRHAIFGEVVEGMDVVQKIVSVPRDANDRPRDKVAMTTVSVISI